MKSSLSALCGIEDRHRNVQTLVHKKASNHRFVDGAIGLGSGFVTSWLGPLGTAASTAVTASMILAQTRLVYRPMANEIMDMYSGNTALETEAHDEANKYEGEERDRMLRHRAFTALYDTQFLLGMMQDHIHEAVVGSALTAIPIFGAFASATIDVMIAATMTWRVGLMTALYYANLGEWIRTRKETFEFTKKLLPLSAKSHERVNIGEIVAQESSIVEKHYRVVKADFIHPLLSDGKTKQEIIDIAFGMKFPDYILRQLPHFSYKLPMIET